MKEFGAEFESRKKYVAEGVIIQKKRIAILLVKGL